MLKIAKDEFMEKTLVLRFRNLVAPDTIEVHKKLIEENGYVWWGWWHKPDEHIPRDFIASLKRETEKLLFLIDSGNKLLYKAIFEDIKMTSDENDLIESPDIKKTPEYYSKNKYMMWFKFKSIESIENTEIQNWAYLKVPNFLEDEQDDIFNNKKVFSVKEMLSRTHRTIYFIQKFLKGKHKENEVTIILGPELKNFTMNPILGKSNVVLHISDLHFGTKHAHASEQQSKLKLSLFDLLFNDLKAELKGKIPSIVIASGDFTCTGSEEEFGEAARFLNRIRIDFQLQISDFIIIPGNHDITWNEIDFDENKIKERLEIEEKNYKLFYEKFTGVTANEYLSMGRRVILDNYVTLDIIGLNSCLLEQKKFAGFGYVGMRQMSNAIQEMNWQEVKKEHLRLVVLHHHLIPIESEEIIDKKNRTYSLTLDSGNLIYQFLKNNVDIVLHGHKHQPTITTISRAPQSNLDYPIERKLNVISAGSIGAKKEDLGEIGKNAYNILIFEKDHLILKRRATAELSRGFQPYSDDLKFEFDSNFGLTLKK